MNESLIIQLLVVTGLDDDTTTTKQQRIDALPIFLETQKSYLFNSMASFLGQFHQGSLPLMMKESHGII